MILGQARSTLANCQSHIRSRPERTVMTKRSLTDRISEFFQKQGLGARAARRYAKQSASFWRPATIKELAKAGLPPKSERFIPRTAKRISAKTPFLSRSQHVELRTGLSPKQLSSEHQFGARQYASQSRREAAAKIRAKAGRPGNAALSLWQRHKQGHPTF